jgi:hypothetical protein
MTRKVGDQTGVVRVLYEFNGRLAVVQQSPNCL